MKKIIAGLIISLSIMGISLNSVSAYQLSAEKQEVITKSLSPKLIAKIDKIVAKWDEEKTYNIYKKIKKVVIKLQMKVLKRTDLSEAKKKDLINKYNAILYIIEKHVAEKYAPHNESGDSI